MAIRFLALGKAQKKIGLLRGDLSSALIFEASEASVKSDFVRRIRKKQEGAEKSMTKHEARNGE